MIKQKGEVFIYFVERDRRFLSWIFELTQCSSSREALASEWQLLGSSLDDCDLHQTCFIRLLIHTYYCYLFRVGLSKIWFESYTYYIYVNYRRGWLNFLNYYIFLYITLIFIIFFYNFGDESFHFINSLLTIFTLSNKRFRFVWL